MLYGNCSLDSGLVNRKLINYLFGNKAQILGEYGNKTARIDIYYHYHVITKSK